MREPKSPGCSRAAELSGEILAGISSEFPARLLAGILLGILVYAPVPIPVLIPGLHRGAASAAEITVMPVPSDAGSALVLLSGSIERADDDRFRQATARLPGLAERRVSRRLAPGSDFKRPIAVTAPRPDY